MITSVIREACERRSPRSLNSVTSCRANGVPCGLPARSRRRQTLPLHNAPAFREYSHSPDTGTYCIDYVTSQLTVTGNTTYERGGESRAGSLAAAAVWQTRDACSSGVDVGEEGAQRLRTHRADGYISRWRERGHVQPLWGSWRDWRAGRAPPRASEPRRLPRHD